MRLVLKSTRRKSINPQLLTLRRSEGFCEEIEEAQSRGGDVENDDDDGEN